MPQTTTEKPMPNRLGLLMNEIDAAEQAHQERHPVEHHDAQRGEDDRSPELVGDLDDPRAVEHEHDQEDRQRRTDRLDDDAVLERLVHPRDRTDGEAVADRVDRPEELRQHRLEVGDDHGDEADDDADERDRRHLVGLLAGRSGRAGGLRPAERGRRRAAGSNSTAVAVIVPLTVMTFLFQLDDRTVVDRRGARDGSGLRAAYRARPSLQRLAASSGH